VAIIFNVFMGSALSAVWLIAVGAWLATHIGVADALLALKTCGDFIQPGFGAILAGTSIAALVATVAMTGYSAMLTAITTWDSLKSVHPTRSLRIWVLCAVTALWVTIAMSCHEDAIVYLNAMLVLVLYFLMPWTAVNLVDYFLLRRGCYSLRDLFSPTGLYGAWGKRGLIAYAIGFLVSAPFFVVPGLFTGPLAARLDGVDIGWLVSPISASLAYLWLSRHFDAAGEIRAIRDMGPNLP
jgi:purine-cytosine permease-like protein